MKTLRTKADCIVTSPPYYGLRDYGTRGQLGLEPSPLEYLERLIAVFDGAKRVLKPAGSCYVNLGDVYQEKQLMLLPFRFALGMEERGWILRNAIVWHKPNSIPSSVRDRLKNSWEPLFHFVRNRHYYYDLDAIRVPHESLKDALRLKKAGKARIEFPGKWERRGQRAFLAMHPLGKNPGDVMRDKTKANFLRPDSLRLPPEPRQQGAFHPKGKNPGDIIRAHPVRRKPWLEKSWASNPGHPFTHKATGKPQNPGDFWKISTCPYPEAHFAVFPEALCERPIKSSCPPGGVVLDPFAGSGTVAKVAMELGRSGICIDLNPAYRKFWKKRLDSARQNLVWRKIKNGIEARVR